MNIPVYDDNQELICNVTFKENLTRENVPDYVNMNCKIGLTRYPGIRFQGYYVLMYYDKLSPNRSYGEIITSNEAYEMCIKQGHEEVIEQENILFEREREVL